MANRKGRTWNRGAPVRPAGPGAGPRVWATASGKGGVGKSVVAASLAIAFAQQGRRCALIDLDLGGANLHTMVGAPRLRPNLSDFLRRDVASLSEVMGATGISNLWLASGDRSAADAANPKHTQKEKLIRHIRALDFDDVFLDLGAGSAFHVMDFFLAAEYGILVSTPEPTAIENAYHFIKAVFFRSLGRTAREADVAEALGAVLDQRSSRGVRSPLDLVRAVGEIDPNAGQILLARARAFRPMLLINQIRDERQQDLGLRLVRDCRRHLGAEMQLVGSLPADPCIPSAVQRGEPVLRLFPNGSFAQSIDMVARHLLASSGRSHERRIRPKEGPTPLRRVADPVQVSQTELRAPGLTLRRRREALGLGLDTLIDRTRIHCLEEIEQELFDRLPPEVHLRGFVDQYARALCIAEPAPLVEAYIARVRRAHDKSVLARRSGLGSPAVRRPAGNAA